MKMHFVSFIVLSCAGVGLYGMEITPGMQRCELYEKALACQDLKEAAREFANLNECVQTSVIGCLSAIVSDHATTEEYYKAVGQVLEPHLQGCTSLFVKEAFQTLVYRHALALREKFQKIESIKLAEWEREEIYELERLGIAHERTSVESIFLKNVKEIHSEGELKESVLKDVIARYKRSPSKELDAAAILLKEYGQLCFYFMLKIKQIEDQCIPAYEEYKRMARAALMQQRKEGSVCFHQALQFYVAKKAIAARKIFQQQEGFALESKIFVQNRDDALLAAFLEKHPGGAELLQEMRAVEKELSIPRWLKSNNNETLKEEGSFLLTGENGEELCVKVENLTTYLGETDISWKSHISGLILGVEKIVEKEVYPSACKHKVDDFLLHHLQSFKVGQGYTLEGWVYKNILQRYAAAFFSCLMENKKLAMKVLIRNEMDRRCKIAWLLQEEEDLKTVDETECSIENNRSFSPHTSAYLTKSAGRGDEKERLLNDYEKALSTQSSELVLWLIEGVQSAGRLFQKVTEEGGVLDFLQAIEDFEKKTLCSRLSPGCLYMLFGGKHHLCSGPLEENKKRGRESAGMVSSPKVQRTQPTNNNNTEE